MKVTKMPPADFFKTENTCSFKIVNASQTNLILLQLSRKTLSEENMFVPASKYAEFCTYSKIWFSRILQMSNLVHCLRVFLD